MKADIDVNSINASEIIKNVRKTENPIKIDDKIVEYDGKNMLREEDTVEKWKEKLLNTLYNKLYLLFERLAQRLLGKSGFFSS